MKLKKYGAFLLNVVTVFANGDMSCQKLDMDYSGYIIKNFPEFGREHPRLSRKFANTIDVAYEGYSWMDNDNFRGCSGRILGDSTRSKYLLMQKLLGNHERRPDNSYVLSGFRLRFLSAEYLVLTKL